LKETKYSVKGKSDKCTVFDCNFTGLDCKLWVGDSMVRELDWTAHEAARIGLDWNLVKPWLIGLDWTVHSLSMTGLPQSYH